jgi:hypothetical protein
MHMAEVMAVGLACYLSRIILTPAARVLAVWAARKLQKLLK